MYKVKLYLKVKKRPIVFELDTEKQVNELIELIRDSRDKYIVFGPLLFDKYEFRMLIVDEIKKR